MTDRVFVDSNVLLYRFSKSDLPKQQRAQAWLDALWSADAGRVSWQVLFEFYANATRKLKIPPAAARLAVDQLLEWNPEQPNQPALLRAWHWCDSAQVNFWDGLIIAAAEQAGCRWLLSEDFQSERKFGSVTVVSPFQSAPSQFGWATR